MYIIHKTTIRQCRHRGKLAVQKLWYNDIVNWCRAELLWQDRTEPNEIINEASDSDGRWRCTTSIDLGSSRNSVLNATQSCLTWHRDKHPAKTAPVLE